MKCPYCEFEWQTEKEIYEVQLSKLVEDANPKDESIQSYTARKKLEGWSNNRILCSIAYKNKDNQKAAFMEAIKYLRGTKVK